MIAATVALAALAALSPSDPPKPDDAPAVLRLINAARTEAGAVPLVENPLLDRVAQASAERVAGARNLSEAEDASRNVGKRVAAAGYEHRRVEEIVLTGDGAFEDRLARLRESDPETFAEVVNPDYRDLGVGMAEGAAGAVRVFVFPENRICGVTFSEALENFAVDWIRSFEVAEGASDFVPH